MPYSAHSLSTAPLTSLAGKDQSAAEPREESAAGPSQFSGSSADSIAELRGAIDSVDGKVLVSGADPIPGNRLPFNLRAGVTPHVLVLSKTPKAISGSIVGQSGTRFRFAVVPADIPTRVSPPSRDWSSMLET